MSSNDTVPLSDTIAQLTLDMPSAVGVGMVGDNGFVAFESRALLDGGDIYDVTISVPSNFGSTDVKVGYSSIRGSSFDEGMRSEIERALNIDPTTGVVTLQNPIDVFPKFAVPVVSSGDHTIDTWEVTVAAIKPADQSFATGPTSESHIHKPHPKLNLITGCCALGPGTCDQTSANDCALQDGRSYLKRPCDFGESCSPLKRPHPPHVAHALHAAHPPHPPHVAHP